jgi:hypothetical protein
LSCTAEKYAFTSWWPGQPSGDGSRTKRRSPNAREALVVRSRFGAVVIWELLEGTRAGRAERHVMSSHVRAGSSGGHETVGMVMRESGLSRWTPVRTD